MDLILRNALTTIAENILSTSVLSGIPTQPFITPLVDAFEINMVYQDRHTHDGKRHVYKCAKHHFDTNPALSQMQREILYLLFDYAVFGDDREPALVEAKIRDILETK